jgi:hypothetical protein
MVRLPIVLTVAFGMLFSTVAGCSGDADGTEHWPESVDEGYPWPWFGSSGPIPPSWQAPAVFGCRVRQRVRREPDGEAAPGNAPRRIVVEELGTVCLEAGATFDVTDDAGDALVLGDCDSGFRLETRRGTLATLQFATPAACESYAAARSDAASKSGAMLVTRLALVTREPAVVEVLESRPPAEDARRGSKIVE